MKRFTLFTGAIAALALTVGSAQAQSYPYYRSAYPQYYNGLQQRELERYHYHNYAHRYPMTHWQHDRLHNQLELDRYNDMYRYRRYSPYQYIAPRSYFQTPYYTVPRSGFSIQTPRFSFSIGR